MFDLQMNNRCMFITQSTILIDTTGPLAQSAERGADNAKVVSSTSHRTQLILFCRTPDQWSNFFSTSQSFLGRKCTMWLANIIVSWKLEVCFFRFQSLVINYLAPK